MLPFAGLRRLELAKAVARDPEVVLIDEPSAGLRAGEVKGASAPIASLRAENGAVLPVDHDVEGMAALPGVAGLSAFYGEAQALDAAALRVRDGESVSAVGLDGAGQGGAQLSAAERARQLDRPLEPFLVLRSRATPAAGRMSGGRCSPSRAPCR